MYPPAVHLETFLAPLRRTRLDVSNLIEVRARGRHVSSEANVPEDIASEPSGLSDLGIFA